MASMDYPFLGRFKNQEETHGHGKSKRLAPTNLQYRVSGENLTVEEIDSSSEHLESLLSQKGRQGHAPLPEAGVTIPNDGRTYYVHSKVEHKESRHYCKLILEGKGAKGPPPVADAPSPPPQRHVPAPADHPRFVVCHTNYSIPGDNGVSITANGQTQRVVVGGDTMLDLSGGGPITVTVPEPPRHQAPMSPERPSDPQPMTPHHVIETPLPKIDVNISPVVNKLVTYSVMLLGGQATKVELRAANLVDQGIGRAELQLDATRSHMVEVSIYAADGYTQRMQQTMTLPVLEKDKQSQPLEIRIEDSAHGRKVVVPSPGATITTAGAAPFPGIPGCNLAAGQSAQLEVKQQDGAAAQLYLQNSAEFEWVKMLSEALNPAATPAADSAAVAAKVRGITHSDPSSHGAQICHYLDSLLSSPAPTLSLSLNETGEALSEIKCDNGGSISATLGSAADAAPCLLANGGQVQFSNTQPVLFEIKKEGRTVNRVRLENRSKKQQAPPPQPGEPVRAVPLNIAAQGSQSMYISFDGGASQLLGATAVQVPLTVSSMNISVPPSGEDIAPPPPVLAPPAATASRLIPAVLKVWDEELVKQTPQTTINGTNITPDGLNLKQGWSGVSHDAAVPNEKDLLDMLQALVDHLLEAQRKANSHKRTTNFQFAVGDGRLHSIACPPYRVLASVDDLPPAPVDVTGCVPPTGTFAPGTQHVVNLTAVDDRGTPVTTTSIRMPVPETSGLAGNGLPPSELEFDLQRLDSKTRLKVKAPGGFKLHCVEVDQQPTTSVGTEGTCLVDLDPDLPHRCTIVATSGALQVYKQHISIPRLALPTMKVFVDGIDVRIQEEEGVLYSFSDNESREVVGTRHILTPDHHHTLLIRQFLTGVSMTQVGEHKLRLPPFIDYEAVAELVNILMDSGSTPWVRLSQRLMRLHGKTRSDKIKELITLLVTHLLAKEGEERLDSFYTRVMETISTIRIQPKAQSNSTLFFRLKGDDGPNH